MLLEVQGVSKAFGGLMALSDVTLTVEAGETVGIMGANGAGKTTLFSLIAGNDRPTAGRILFDGRRIDGRRPDQISRGGIARTFQIVRPFAGMTVVENVAIGCLFGSRCEASKRRALEQARAILDEVGLAQRADHMAGDLTIAGLKRLEVARALAAGPRLLMLDEVMAGLTPTEVAEALAMLDGLKRRHGLTLLVVEHVMRALMEMCGRILVLHHGVTIATGAPDEIGANPAVIDAYLGKET
jgi:branched-chain amino acid transport system ATP-binding protein